MIQNNKEKMVLVEVEFEARKLGLYGNFLQIEEMEAFFDAMRTHDD